MIPYLRDDSTEVTLDDLAAAVIDQYFVPILAGRLEVTLRNGLRNLEIDRDSIEARLAAINWPPRRQLPSAKEMLALVRLAKQYLGLKDSDYHQVPLVGEQTRYHLTDARIQDLSSTFFRGDPIAIEIPVEVRPKNAPVASERVRIVLERDEDLRKGNVRHLRSGIEISKLRENGGAAVRGLVVVGSDFGSQGELDRLLQASEGPAHITWEDRGEGLDRAKMAFIDPGKPIRFMRHVASEIVEQLSAPTEERDVSTLAPFFPDMDGESRSSGQSPGTKEKITIGKTPTPQVPAVPKGTIEGIVQAFGSSQNPAPVDGAQVVLTQGDASIATATTCANGCFTFRDNVAGDYKVTATKPLVGSAASRANLHGDQGVHLSLFLRPEHPPRMFSRVALSDGVAIRGNRLYSGPLKAIRLQFAYASWGGANRFDEADFSLADLPKSSDGVRESLSEMVIAPNVLRFTPLESDFSVEVRGFDPNRALDVRVRAVGDEAGEDSDE
ncbi:MAG: carboxypeptidase-like regulatory domain-containing protein [Pirellulales bacterium]